MEFLPGLELSRRFYFEAVRPRLPSELIHTAALVGAGSDVLGFDTPMSMDHDWGPRVQIFVAEDRDIPVVQRAVARGLPSNFLGFPTTFAVNEDGTDRLESGTDRNRVEATTLALFLSGYLGFDPRPGMAPADWLSVPEQKWRSLTVGAVFHDEQGFEALREKLAYFPDDVWRYQLASLWERVGQEEHLVGRAGYVGDELGAATIAARLVRDLMRLGFAMERVYAPYPKWFGTAFSRLRCAEELGPLLTAVLRADEWQARDAALANAYRVVARMQNETELLERRPTEPAAFFGRPFSVIHLHMEFASGLRAGIRDPGVREIAARRNIGGIDVFSDSTDLVSDPDWFSKVRRLYEAG
ncbi:MAG: DUF4037 domain-containing protein [Fimbriimonas sp.]